MIKFWEKFKTAFIWISLSLLVFLIKEWWLFFYNSPDIIIQNEAVFFNAKIVLGEPKNEDYDFIRRQQSQLFNDKNYPLKLSKIDKEIIKLESFELEKLTTDAWLWKKHKQQVFVWGKKADLNSVINKNISLKSVGWIVLQKGIFPRENFPLPKWIIYTAKKLPKSLKTIAKENNIPLISSYKTQGLSMNYKQNKWNLKVRKTKENTRLFSH